MNIIVAGVGKIGLAVIGIETGIIIFKKRSKR